jgi:hypothetical protein
MPCKRQAKRESDARHREKVRAENRERMRAARVQNPEIKRKERDASREYRRKNAEALRAKERGRSKIRYAADPAQYHARVAKRRSDLLNRTSLLTQEKQKQVKAIYGFAKYLTKKFGKPYHVDHIVPLRGKTCSGLHVPENLRVVTGQLNLSKGAKIDYELVPHAFRSEEN